MCCYAWLNSVLFRIYVLLQQSQRGLIKWNPEAGALVQWLRAVTALPEVLSSNSSKPGPVGSSLAPTLLKTHSVLSLLLWQIQAHLHPVHLQIRRALIL